MDRPKKPTAIPVSSSVPGPSVSVLENRVEASLASGESATVNLFGATVTSWKLADGAEQLFLSENAHLDGSKPIRGGIPLVFPVFGPPPKEHATSALPQHGFARNAYWEFLGKSTSESEGDASVKLDFGLSKGMLSDKFQKDWPFDFGLVYSVTLSPRSLITSLQVQNKGTAPFEFQSLLHTYFRVEDISKIRIGGLQSKTYVDKVRDASTFTEESAAIGISSEVDRVYQSLDPKTPVTVTSEDNKPVFSITRESLNDMVVWNPWVEKAKGMADFTPDEAYKNMKKKRKPKTPRMDRLGRNSPKPAARHGLDDIGRSSVSSLRYEVEHGRDEDEQGREEADRPVTWSSLPKRNQLIILTVARLSEPLAQTSLQAYMFYQLKSFDPSLPDSTISSQTGILQGAFTGAQFLTAVFWGRLADTELLGRKTVLLIGLFGACISTLGFGFSKSFAAAAFFRTLGGALNSNAGVMRTMLSEIVVEKKYQSRAFLLLPMCFNVGVIIGPIMGGLLADPISNYPSVFGPGSWLGGEKGVSWMVKWPFALPNLATAVFILCSTLAIFLGLEETHEVTRSRRDLGIRIGKSISRYLGFSRHSDYQALDGLADPDMPDSFDMGSTGYSVSTENCRKSAPQRRKRLPFRQIWTRNVLLTLVAHTFLNFHTSAFTALCFVFLPTPRAPGSYNGLFHFGGGLGMSSSKVGVATAIIGLVGLPIQIFIYPRVQWRLGTLRSFRIFLPFSPVAYILAPFLVLIPNHPYLVWPALSAVIFLQVVSRTFSLPATVILVNNSVPDRSVLGTLHGVAQSASSASRTLGPLIAGWGLGLGLKHNIVGAIWWSLAIEAFLGWLLTWTIVEGTGLEKSDD
ncbi:MFS transporter [Arthroderma uncinatum]|uniref:MFS transporter n=1 Tax=Arthroderma uncinatum TaxID=74035 RepID=UPI00144AF9EC|nr:MFS transporter [Arthroderma uncinatum]KAF3480874.1 MFS transporter [Arthroderma uncinatum]